ncbi:ankyrin repeat-containing domain protein [Rhexocercosporidium sp. MPI-PUGE-AT-0058]|nr:ankyrin repeat-containing domain protein [Rhexocercosporidium sp. MPI-PUGE-AT-0058]
MSLSTLPSELLHQISTYLSNSSLNTLIQTNTHLATILTPTLYSPELQLIPTACPTAYLNWFAHRVKLRCFSYIHLWKSATLLGYIHTLSSHTVQLPDSNGRTLIQYALEQRNTPLIEILLSKPSININHEDKFQKSYLCTAIITLNITAAQLLVDAGASILTSYYEDQPLACLAVSYGSLPLAKCTISALQKRNELQDLFTPHPSTQHNILASAIYEGNEPTIELLISLGAPTSHISPDGTTILMRAVSTNCDSIVHHLLDQGVSVLPTNNAGESALSLISHRRPGLQKHTITRLISLTLLAGGNTSSPSRTQDKATPLHASASRSHLVGVQALLENGANPLARDVNGYTPLLAALEANTTSLIEPALSNHRATILLLIRSMADFSARADSHAFGFLQGTALHFAAKLADPGIVEALVRAGASPFERDATSRLPMECAFPLDSFRRLLPSRSPVEMMQHEECCLILARAMRDFDPGFDFEMPLERNKAFRTLQTWTLRELAVMAEMHGLCAFLMEGWT